VLALLAFALAAPAQAGIGFDACLAFETAASGTVESVREVPVPRDIHAFDPESVLEHSVRPDTAEVLAVRLDSGVLVLLSPGRAHRLQAGQRVRVTPDGLGFCPTPLARLAQREF
jgi:hypothetical protein